MIPDLSATPLAELANQLAEADRAARAARREAHNLEGAIAAARRADNEAAARATVDGKPTPKATAATLAAKATEIADKADVATRVYRLIEGRLAAALEGDDGKAWQDQLARQVATATDALHAALAHAATATEDIVSARRTLEWIGKAGQHYPRNQSFPPLPIPRAGVQVGASSIDALRLLEAIARWAEPQPELQEVS